MNSMIYPSIIRACQLALNCTAKSVVFLLLLYLFPVMEAAAQSQEEWELAYTYMDTAPKHKHNFNTAFAGNSSSEIQYLFSGLFLFYKAFISSQDGQSCSFTPSCSAYGLDAVRLHGPAKGMLMGFDRLTRCHGMSPEWYTMDPESRLLIDPAK